MFVHSKLFILQIQRNNNILAPYKIYSYYCTDTRIQDKCDFKKTCPNLQCPGGGNILIISKMLHK